MHWSLHGHNVPVNGENEQNALANSHNASARVRTRLHVMLYCINIRRIVEFRHIRVCESLVDGNALAWVEYKQLAHQINRIWCCLCARVRFSINACLYNKPANEQTLGNRASNVIGVLIGVCLSVGSAYTDCMDLMSIGVGRPRSCASNDKITSVRKRLKIDCWNEDTCRIRSSWWKVDCPPNTAEPAMMDACFTAIIHIRNSHTKQHLSKNASTRPHVRW